MDGFTPFGVPYKVFLFRFRELFILRKELENFIPLLNGFETKTDELKRKIQEVSIFVFVSAAVYFTDICIQNFFCPVSNDASNSYIIGLIQSWTQS